MRVSGKSRRRQPLSASASAKRTVWGGVVGEGQGFEVSATAPGGWRRNESGWMIVDHVVRGVRGRSGDVSWLFEADRPGSA